MLIVLLLPSLQRSNGSLVGPFKPGFLSGLKRAELELSDMTDELPTFATKREAQLWLFDYHVSEKKPFKVERSSPDRLVVRCKEEGVGPPGLGMNF